MHPHLRRYAPDVALLALCVPYVVAGLSNLPFGDHPHSAYFYGADAGEWALNAQLVASGHFDAVDRHRGPPFLAAIALARQVTPDLARAGHLAIAAAWAVRPFLMYGLGRMCGGRLVGAIAALLTVSLLPLYYSAAKYGVDPFLTTMLPLALLVVAPARRFPTWAWVAGSVAGVVMLTHLTAVPYFLPALMLLAWRGSTPGRPLPGIARPLLFASGVLGLLLAAHFTFGLIGTSELLHSVSEGVAKDAAGSPGEAILSDRASATLLAGRYSAATGATQALLLPFLNDLDEWGLYLGLVWAGLVGVSLGPSTPTDGPPTLLRPFLGTRPDRRWRSWLDHRHPLARLTRVGRSLHTDAGTGFILLCTLAPAPFFAAAHAPERYTHNLLPFVSLLIARGAASGVATITRFVPKKARTPALVVLGAAVLGLVVPLTRDRLETARAFVSPPGRDAVASLALSRSVRRHVDTDSAVASPIREVAAYLDREHCPRASCVPMDGTAGFERCVAHLRQSCAGTGDIPLVWVEEGPVGMGDDPFLQAFGAWATDTYGAKGRYSGSSLQATIIALPRSD